MALASSSMARRPHRLDDEVQRAWAVVAHDGYRYCEASCMAMDCESESSNLATERSKLVRRGE
jgi:hypothetical protein